jgi:hypothetical protein
LRTGGGALRTGDDTGRQEHSDPGTIRDVVEKDRHR